jgi:hypothetical protein
VDGNGEFVRDDVGDCVVLGEEEIEMLRRNGQLEEVLMF